MANAFAYRPPPGIVDVEEGEDYHGGIQRGYRVLRSRILIANVLKNAGMSEEFQSIVEYTLSAQTPRDPSQRGCPTITGFNTKVTEFEKKLMELASKDSEPKAENAGIQLEEHKRFLALEELAGQLVEELASYRPLIRSMIEPMLEKYRQTAGRFARYDNVRRAILQLQNSLDRMYVAKREQNDDQKNLRSELDRDLKRLLSVCDQVTGRGQDKP